MQYMNLCEGCKNYIKEKKCKAFDKIPDEIWIGPNDHSKPLPKQGNDIVYEKIKK
jgi:hypothetical protein